MSWLPVGTPLGDLEIVEEFVDFDGPRLFSCRSKTDQLYVAGWAEEGETEDLWLYLPVSKGRLAAIRSGAINLREGYLHPEGFLYLATLPHAATTEDSVVPVRRGGVQENWLPAPDFALRLSTPTASAALNPEQLARLAEQEGRTRLDLQVHLPDYLRTEAPTRKIGEVLTALQGVLDNFGALELEDTPPQAGALPEHVTQAMASNIVSLSAASFVVGIASTEGLDLFADSPFAKAVARLVDVASNEISDEAVSQEVRELKPRGARSYRRFIRELADTHGDVALNAGSPGFGHKSARLDSEKLRRLSELLDSVIAEEPTEIRGRMVLVAADTEKMRFGLRDLETDSLYQGKVSKAAEPQVSKATLQDEYSVILTEEAVSEGATGETKFAYTLEQLLHVVEGDDDAALAIAPEDAGSSRGAPWSDGWNTAD